MLRAPPERNFPSVFDVHADIGSVMDTYLVSVPAAASSALLDVGGGGGNPFRGSAHDGSGRGGDE